MKNKNFFGCIINPFVKIAGWKALGLGLMFVFVSGYLGSLGNVAFDGVIDTHFVKSLSLGDSFLLLFVDVVILAVVMGLLSLTVTKGFRFIDVLGTLTLARAPFLLLAIAGLFTEAPELSAILNDPYSIFHSTSFVLFMLLTILVLIWFITLIYNALNVSTGIKGSKLTAVFLVALLIAEVLSKIVSYKILIA